MIEVAEAEFVLDIPDRHNLTPRQRNLINERAGKTDEGWRPEPPPFELLAVWKHYLSVHSWRGTMQVRSMDKETKKPIIEWIPRQLTLEMIDAWSRLTGVTVSQWELDIFARLESSFWRARRGETAQGDDSQLLTRIKSTFLTMSKEQPKKGLRTIELKGKG